MENMNWTDIRPGDQLTFENKYYLKALVTILKDRSDGKHWRFDIRIDRITGGIYRADYQEGDCFTVSRIKDERYDYLLQVAFRPDVPAGRRRMRCA